MATPPAIMTGRSFLPLLTVGPHTLRTHVFRERGPHVGLPEQSASFDQLRTIIGTLDKLIYNALWQIPYRPVDFADTPARTSIAVAQKAGKLSTVMARVQPRLAALPSANSTKVALNFILRIHKQNSVTQTKVRGEISVKQGSP
jgi:hypothetical protein